MDGSTDRLLARPDDKDVDPEVKIKSGKERDSPPKVNIPMRYVVCFLAFIGYVCLYFIRANFSVAIVEMVSKHNVSTGNGTWKTHQDFNWDTKMQGVILSSFFWGYVAMQIPGGFISNKFGGRKTFGIGVLLPAAFTLMTPFIARIGGYWGVVVLRVLEGIAEGVSVPAMIDFWSKWAPAMERTKLVCMSNAGIATGVLISMPISGLLAAYYSWQSIFYVSGACGVVWTIFWLIFASETPEGNRFITEEERHYIVNTRGTDEATPVRLSQVPWRQIIKSVPLYALFIARVCTSWGFYTVMTELPTYMKKVLDFDIAKSGFTSGLPFLVLTVVQIIASNVVDVIRKREIVSTTKIRRACAVLGYTGQAVFILLTSFTDNSTVTVAYFTLAMGFGGITVSTMSVNIIDLAPKYSGILMGVANCITNVPGIVSPVVTGFIIRNNTFNEWRIVFYICSAVYAFGALVFGLFGSGEAQPWSHGAREGYQSIQA